MSPVNELQLVPSGRVARAIMVVHGHNVMLDSDLAELYGVETRTLNQAVKRNPGRFPQDFMFQLSDKEAELLLRSRSQTGILKRGQNVKYRPYVFTEQGVAMLSSVLRSERAVAVNVEIMRAFVRMREMLASHKELAKRLGEIEAQVAEKFETYDQAIAEIFKNLHELMNPPITYAIGFTADFGESREPEDRVLGEVDSQRRSA
jgi:ORF6N domain.